MISVIPEGENVSWLICSNRIQKTTQFVVYVLRPHFQNGNMMQSLTLKFDIIVKLMHLSVPCLCFYPWCHINLKGKLIWVQEAVSRPQNILWVSPLKFHECHEEGFFFSVVDRNLTQRPTGREREVSLVMERKKQSYCSLFGNTKHWTVHAGVCICLERLLIPTLPPTIKK